MRSSRRRDELTRFLRRLPLAALAAALLWLAARGAWDPTVCAAAQAFARLYEVPRVAQIIAQDHFAVIGRSDLRADSARLRVGMPQITFNLIPFLALVLATPAALRGKGWRRLLLGIGVLAAVHALGLVLHLKFFYAFSLGAWSRANYSDVAREIYGGMRYFFDIPVTFSAPLLLWVGLFPDRVLPLVGIDRSPSTGH